MNASDYRGIARENLAGNWKNAILAALLAAMLGGLIVTTGFELNLNLEDEELYSHTFQQLNGYLTVTATAATGLNLLHFILGGVIRQGYAIYLLKQHDRRNPETRDLFSQFDHFGDGFCLAFLQNLYIILWTLLFIIPGIIKSFSYAMAPFLLAENPDMTANEAITASKELMEGHKAELFFLHLSFIGWEILAAFTLGIGYLWVNPYKNAAYAAFYRNLTRPRIEA